MSSAACAKKRACNPPVRAAAETADGIVEVILDAMAEGNLAPEDGELMILMFAANDDAYLARHKKIVEHCIEMLGGISDAKMQAARQAVTEL